jgi:hypothetical protein
LAAAATVGDGILKFSEAEFQQKPNFDAHKTNLKLLKFVPAPGKLPAECLSFNLLVNQFDPAKESINAYINRIKIT